MKKLLFLSLILSLFSTPSYSSDVKPPKDVNWSFEGPTGHFDRAAAQRGFQVYKEVCSSCHSLKLLSYRNLEEIGFEKEEVKVIASQYTTIDGPDDSGDMFERPARPSDKFVAPFANEKAARASNGGAFPPDLSLITKARVGGANYVYSIITGYNIVPSDIELDDGMNYNLYFPGRQIAMPPPLSDGLVQYSDGTEASVDQMAHDVVTFLYWAAEPKMEHRKSLGAKVLLFMLVFTGLFIAAKKRVWSDLEDKH